MRETRVLRSVLELIDCCESMEEVKMLVTRLIEETEQAHKAGSDDQAA